MSESALLTPTDDESVAIARLEAEVEVLRAERVVPRLVSASGEEIEIPASVFDVLRVVVDAMALGRAVTVVPHEHELTSQQAADLLAVSRPHLIKLLERGEIPFHRVGRSHRRIRMEDVLAYRERRAAERERLLTQIARDAQDAGAYRADAAS